MNSSMRWWRAVGSFSALTLLLLASYQSNAWSIQVWLSDESGFGFHDGPYARNEAIYISGEWDVYDFPCPKGDIYLVKNSPATWSGTVAIHGIITKKVVVGCGGAGAFYGEILRLPPLFPGEFDIVMDENQDGEFNEGVDYVLGNGPGYALIVIDQMLDQGVDVAGIKQSAFKEGTRWTSFAKWMDISLRGVGLAALGVTSLQLAAIHPALGIGYLIIGAGGTFLGYAMDYNGAIRGTGCKMMTTAGWSMADAKFSLAADPPDYNYTELVALAPIVYEEEISTSSLNNSMLRLRNSLAEQSVLTEAFRKSYEKFLGAEDDEAYEYALLQARSAREYCDGLIETLESSSIHLDSLEAAIQATGWADSVFSAAGAQSLQQRVATIGFTQAEIDTLLAVGMLPQEIDSVESEISNMALAGLTDRSFQSLIDSLSYQMATALVYYDGAAQDLDSVLTVLQYAYTSVPVAVISGPGTGPEGAQLLLDGSGSSDPESRALSYAWDTDMDGAFDDGANITIQFLANHQGDCLIGLKVTNTLGQSDIAYRRIAVTDVNRMPYFVEKEPENLYLVLGGGARDFSVTVGDPDSDPVSVTWLVGDEEVGSGLSYHFEPPDTGIFHVRARASDGSSLSPDNYYGWRVRVIGTGTGVDEEPRAPGLNVVLHQNYPNPFNPATTISFSLPASARVRLAMYDVTGRLVKVLVDDRLGEGLHHIVWDGNDLNGAPASSGVYLCRLQADGRELMKKMVLLR